MNILQILKPVYNECYVNNIKIDSDIIINNKCFHGDILNSDYTVKYSDRDNFLIGGVIKFNNKYSFGLSDKQVELFEFQPINWRYPNFLIPSNIKRNNIKNKKQIIDYFVVIKFKEWKSKLPIGYIFFDLGPINNIINQYDILLYYYPNNPIIKQKQFEILKIDEDKNDSDITIHDEIYSIDPVSCTDIDDAISYDFDKNRIGIHISDLTYINSFDQNYKIGNILYSSVYAPHKTIHMMPEIIATNYFSLLQNKIRHVITCWINNDMTYSFECNIIKITKNLSYDEAELLLYTNESLSKLFVKSIEIGKILKIDVTNTHKMIEVYMILYNTNMAKLLEKNKNMIFRNQILLNKAEYNFDRTEHNNLGLTYYTHATSPIRRYVDQIIQKIYKHNLVNKVYTDIINLDKINEYEKNIKKLYKMWDYLKASNIIINGTEYELELKEKEINKLVFFCSKLNITIINKVYFDISDYEINKIYNKLLYVITDKKNILFFKILIKF